MNLGIYLRISSDPNNDEQATARQEEDCRAYCIREGHAIAGVYRDTDLSGYKRVVRPAFDQMLKDLAARKLDGFVAYRVERILRNWRDWVRLEDIREKSGGFALTLDGNDSRSPTGRNQFELFVYMAKMESERISERTKRKHLDSARKGLPNPGGYRPFGYEKSHSAIREDEAALVREAVGRILSGWTWVAVAQDWCNRGVVTQHGKLWSASNLHKMMTGAHLAGLRVHEGKTYPATWPAIITSEQHSRLVRQPRAAKGPNHRSLLSGIGVCGLCGHKLRRGPGKGEFATYSCIKEPHTPGSCGKVVRRQSMVDAAVRDRVLAAIEVAEMSPAQVNVETAGVEAEIREVESALSDLADARFVHRHISLADYSRLHTELSARLEELTATLTNANGNGVSLDASTFLATWERETIEWRRMAVRSIFSRVALFPGRRGARVFDPAGLAVAHVDDPEEAGETVL